MRIVRKKSTTPRPVGRWRLPPAVSTAGARVRHSRPSATCASYCTALGGCARFCTAPTWCTGRPAVARRPPVPSLPRPVIALPCGAKHTLAAAVAAVRATANDGRVPLPVGRRFDVRLHGAVLRIRLTAAVGGFVRHCGGGAQPVNQTLAPPVRVICSLPCRASRDEMRHEVGVQALYIACLSDGVTASPFDRTGKQIFPVARQSAWTRYLARM